MLKNNESMVSRHEMIVDGVGKSAQYWHGACYDATHDPVGNYAGNFTIYPKMPKVDLKKGSWAEIIFNEKEKDDG